MSDDDDDLPEVSEIIQQARAKSSAVEKWSSSFTEDEQDQIKREPGIKQEPKIKKEVVVKEEDVDSEEF